VLVLCRGWLGTDMLKVRPGVQVIADPYIGEDVVAFPAVTCDVTVIHALRADWAGNAVLGGNLTVAVELSLVAKRVIVTAEKVVDRLDGPVALSGIPVERGPLRAIRSTLWMGKNCCATPSRARPGSRSICAVFWCRMIRGIKG